MPVPYPFYILVVCTIATLILFVQQPELATRVAASVSALPPRSLLPITPKPTHATIAPPHDLKPRRVAIVGAGASGSAAAFFLARAARETESRADVPHGSLLHIVVYEREDYIGGRELIRA
jgi:prenylcysteine oxidase/farnesylcysteine lyase